MGDRCISRKLEGKELALCVTPAYMYGLEDDGTNRETTGEGPGLRKQLGKN